MDDSSLNFMTCDQLREAFAKCPDDINKRILIIDVRNRSSYDRSHLCLDSRNNKSSIKTKMRVMNIDPDLTNVCTSKKIMALLNESDLTVFRKRRDATEVVLIDEHTDNMNELVNQKSKVMRIINALTKFDNQPEEKIVVPVHVLKGGFGEWLLKYPHFTTNPLYETDSVKWQNGDTNHKQAQRPPNNVIDAGDPDDIMKPIPTAPPSDLKPSIPQPRPTPVNPPIPLQSSKPSIPVKPAVTPPQRQATKPNVVKIAPGTAVPVTPVLSLRSALPRSHSSPNVAQPEAEELDGVFDNLAVSHNIYQASNNCFAFSPSESGSVPVASNSDVLPIKPRFDRTLKPAFNLESIIAIKAQLNFGRSPDASGKAMTGLQNLGNTCFMNSVIQCLAYIPDLVSYFCSNSYYNHINFNSSHGSKGELAVELGALIEKLNVHKHRYIEPKSFRDSVVKHVGFAGNEQQDSHEFMMMLFEKLHHDLNVHAKDKLKQNGIAIQQTNENDDSNINIPRATLGYQFWKRHLEQNKSIISDLFEGIFMSTLTCTVCKGQSNTFEVFNCLSLPIPSESRCQLRDCLNHFSNPERIDAVWECPRCKQKREADKKIVICKLPKILIIHLKRFSLDGRWRQKLQTTVDFPLTDLSVDYTNVLPQSAYGSMPYKSSYNLCAVVNHFGHLDGGHYTAFCRLDKQRWYTFDDSNVSEMRDSDVCGSAAYILFYSASSM